MSTAELPAAAASTTAATTLTRWSGRRRRSRIAASAHSPSATYNDGTIHTTRRSNGGTMRKTARAAADTGTAAIISPSEDPVAIAWTIPAVAASQNGIHKVVPTGFSATGASWRATQPTVSIGPADAGGNAKLQ